jgi:hypothetical protein
MYDVSVNHWSIACEIASTRAPFLASHIGHREKCFRGMIVESATGTDYKGQREYPGDDQRLTKIDHSHMSSTGLPNAEWFRTMIHTQSYPASKPMPL